MATRPQLEVEPYISLDQDRKFQNLLNLVLHEERGRNAREGRGVAIVSPHSGAGTTFISRSIAHCVNKAAARSEISRMAGALSEKAHSLSGYGETARMVSAFRSSVAESSEAVHPSRLAITVDLREVSQAGAEFGAVVAEGLDDLVLRSRTEEGETVQSILNGLPVEWDSMSACRKECFRTLASTFRLVLVDVPSLKESSEIQIIAPIVDGVIIVVEAERTTTKQLARLTNVIESVGGKILGYVLNKRRYPIPEFLYKHLDKAGLT